ncbi:PucR family transcriptional regulator [Paenibacillus sp. YN15]|nr:PucR family transcriptional regulator [Paenibacillus sp. YN15]
MGADFLLTVREALKRSPFAGARLMAGAGGLDRQIRWVHILEISTLENLIYGGEMILATGVGFNLDTAHSVRYMEKLIQQNAACLCIEIGPYFHAVPEELRELADRCGFPLILLPHSIRFVDITQDLHSLIINRHHRTLRELESISREFHRLTLTANGTLNVLKLLHKSTSTQLIYRPLNGTPVCYPPLTADKQDQLLASTDACFKEQEAAPSAGADTVPKPYFAAGSQIVLQSIGVLNQNWAYLALICHREPVEFDYLLLDSAALSIAQELLRTRYMEERKLFSENLWVDELLNNRLTDEKQVKAMLGPSLNRYAELYIRVCLIEIGNLHDESLQLQETDAETIRYHLSLLLRSIFEKHGFRLFLTMKNNRLAAIAVDKKNSGKAKARLQSALDALGSLRADDKLRDLKLAVGVGKAYSSLSQVYMSHREAVQALALHSCFRKPALFYEDLGVFQLLALNDTETLRQFVRSYLGAVLDYDQAKGSDLLTTLRIFLDHDGSKQVAAQKLFIVRQSLYYRLEKLKELLGEDFMVPETRLAISVALRAHQMLPPDRSDHIPNRIKNPSG